MITLLGSGNVATWMAQRLQHSFRFPITQVYSRTLGHARVLSDLCGAQAVDNIKELNPDNQIFIFALADKAYDEILPQLPFKLPMAFLTSGTVSCQCLKNHADRYGVIYPLQTFTKSQDMRALEVPLCLEGPMPEPPPEPTLPSVGNISPQSVGNISPQRCGDSHQLMRDLARELSPLCYEVSEAQRAQMHVAAVFACNFSNAMCQIAYKLLEEKGLSFEMLLPLLRQTVVKLETMTPAEAQTGPAARCDENVMRSQMESLPNDRLKELYKLVSDTIMERNDLDK